MRNARDSTDDAVNKIGETMKDYFIVRTKYAGVHFGKLVSRTGEEVVLNESRRIWRWYGANTCSELALHGLDVKKSRVAEEVSGHLVREVIEMIPCSEEAIACFKEARWVK
jgi:hypothetical protein